MSLKSALAEAVKPKRTPLTVERIYATLDDDDKKSLREAFDNPDIGPTVIANALNSLGHNVGIGAVKSMRTSIQRGERTWEH